MKHLQKDQSGRIHADFGGMFTVVPADFSRFDALAEISSMHCEAEDMGLDVPDWNEVLEDLKSCFS